MGVVAQNGGGILNFGGIGMMTDMMRKLREADVPGELYWPLVDQKAALQQKVNDLEIALKFYRDIKVIWVGSEQRSDAEWYVVKAFRTENFAKTWMYEASNRAVETVDLDSNAD